MTAVGARCTATALAASFALCACGGGGGVTPAGIGDGSTPPHKKHHSGSSPIRARRADDPGEPHLQRLLRHVPGRDGLDHRLRADQKRQHLRQNEDHAQAEQARAQGRRQPVAHLSFVHHRLSERRHGRLQSRQVVEGHARGRRALRIRQPRADRALLVDRVAVGHRRRDVPDSGQRELHGPSRPDSRRHASSARRPAWWIRRPPRRPGAATPTAAP